MEQNNDQSDFKKSRVSVIKTEISVKVTQKDLTKKLIKRVEGKILTPDEIEKHTPNEVSINKN